MKGIKYPLIKPSIDQRGLKAVEEVLQNDWLTHGRYAEKVEEWIKQYIKINYAFVLNSATSCLIAGIRSLGLKPEDEVIIPSFTFPATANSVILGGAKPVFCDIDLKTYNIDPQKIKSLITKCTKAIMVVHQFGLPADMRTILRIAKRHNLIIIEDAACALGAEYGGRKAGAFGNIGVFSFHPRKIITCGEGGCLVTDSSTIAKKTAYLRNHGEYKGRFVGCGYNFRLTDIQAAVLLSQIENIEKLIQRRIRLAANYSRLFKPLEDREVLKRPFCPGGCKHIYQSYVILLSKCIDRDKLKGLLKEKGIEVQFGTHCLPSLDFFKKNFKVPKESYRNSYYAFRHTLTLPLYHTLKYEEQVYIVEALTKSIKRCAG